jgi:Na+/alanine symporter
MRWLARAGLAARGVTYVIIGWIAVQVAFGRSRQQADRTGALHSISSTPVGGALLWLLVIGFIGMALWQLSEALYGSPGSGGSKTSKRLAAFARAIMYGVIAYGVLKYALGLGSPQSSDTQSVDLTATLLKHPGGQALVVVIIVFLTAGIFLVIAAVDVRPQQAKGIDSSLRALAATPLGPWLLVLVAIGLIMFGLFSCCQAKWMRR